MKFLSSIANIEQIVKKGQGFARQHKEREIRAELRDIRRWESNIEFADVWAAVKLYLARRLRSVRGVTG